MIDMIAAHPKSCFVTSGRTCGLVSLAGVFPLARTLDCVGGLAQTVRDAGLLLNPIDSGDNADASTIAYLCGDGTRAKSATASIA